MAIIKSSGYTINIGKNALNGFSNFILKSNYSKFLILCDENSLTYCVPDIIKSCKKLKNAELIEIESGEANKSLEICVHIWQTLLEQNTDRDTLIINVGGGVITDMGGFIASVYKRGIDFINIPTTLLAMVDASVGGKTGIDFINVKNAIGTVTQPKAVFIIPEFLKTLSQRQFSNGLAEAYKIALTCDKAFWNKLCSGKHTVEELLVKSVSLKNDIVKKDPYEKGIRKVLNFGHSIGHAIESAYLTTQNELLHGEAIIIGMIAESHISYQKKLINKTDLKNITETLKEIYSGSIIKENDFELIHQFLLNDKKNRSGKLLFSLINGIGKYKLNVNINLQQINKALNYYNTTVE